MWSTSFLFIYLFIFYWIFEQVTFTWLEIQVVWKNISKKWKFWVTCVQVPLLLLPNTKPFVLIVCVSFQGFFMHRKPIFKIFSPSFLFIQKGKYNRLGSAFFPLLILANFPYQYRDFSHSFWLSYSILLITSTIINLACPELKVIVLLPLLAITNCAVLIYRVHVFMCKLQKMSKWFSSRLSQCMRVLISSHSWQPSVWANNFKKLCHSDRFLKMYFLF